MFLFFFKAKTDKKKPFISFFLKINFKDLKEGLEPQSKKNVHRIANSLCFFVWFFFLLIFVANFVQLRPPMDLFGDFNFYSGDLVENFKKKTNIYIYIYTYKKNKKNDKKPKMLKHIQNKKNIRKRNKKNYRRKTKNGEDVCVLFSIDDLTTLSTSIPLFFDRYIYIYIQYYIHYL